MDESSLMEDYARKADTEKGFKGKTIVFLLVDLSLFPTLSNRMPLFLRYLNPEILSLQEPYLFTFDGKK